MKALTANRLTDGEVVFWKAGQWVERFADAPVAVGHDLQRAYGLVVIGQRFAHAHENDMRDAPITAQRAARFQNLIDDFASR